MATVSKNSSTIVGSNGSHSYTKTKGSVNYWLWRPLLKIAEQVTGTIDNPNGKANVSY